MTYWFSLLCAIASNDEDGIRATASADAAVVQQRLLDERSRAAAEAYEALRRPAP